MSPIVNGSKIILPDNATVTTPNKKPSNNKEPLAIEPLGNIPPMEQPLDASPVNLPLSNQDIYSQMTSDAVAPKENIINNQKPNNILREVNSDRHDPLKTPQLKDNPVEPIVNKTTQGIGGDRDPIDVLKNEGDLTQARIQKVKLDADIYEKPNEFPLKEEKLDNNNNGSREDGSEQSTENEEPYKGEGKDTANGEKPMQGMTGTLNQWNETDRKQGYYNPYKSTRKKEIQTQKPLSPIAEHYKQNLARIDISFIPPNRTTTREITQKSIPSNTFNRNNKSTTIRKGNTSVTF